MESEREADRAAGSHGHGVQSFDAEGGKTAGAHGEGRTDVEQGRDGRPDRDARPEPQHGENESLTLDRLKRDIRPGFIAQLVPYHPPPI